MKIRKPSKLKLRKQAKVRTVMHEWKAGKLNNKFGSIVRYPEDRKVAIAVALSEANKLNNKKRK